MAWATESVQTIVQLADDSLNISCVKTSVPGPQDCFLGSATEIPSFVCYHKEKYQFDRFYWTIPVILDIYNHTVIVCKISIK